MRLSQREFNAMNNPLRRLVQEAVEYPILRGMGLGPDPGDVLEIGCGSGYGAALLARLKPRSYIGIDLMPEQIALAQARGLNQAEFIVGDATDLVCFADGSKDTIVIFGILHHIPEWRKVVCESARLLRVGGKFFIEEPDGELIRRFDRLFNWGHPGLYPFRLRDFEAALAENNLNLLRRLRTLGFGWYAAQKGLDAGGNR